MHPLPGRRTRPWEDLALFPLVSGGRASGSSRSTCAAGAGPATTTTGLPAALADQAAVAVRNSTLFRAAEQTAALEERQRLARELHDSVSQALFSMTLHARTAQRHLETAGPGRGPPVAVEVEQLQELTQAALAEMRALIFELRPGALAEEGLVAALTKQAAAMAAREQVAVAVHGADGRDPARPTLEEHLYRIALEAMHNAVKHARPERVDVRLENDGTGLELRVSDDGVGFDPGRTAPGTSGCARCASGRTPSARPSPSTPHPGAAARSPSPCRSPADSSTSLRRGRTRPQRRGRSGH